MLSCLFIGKFVDFEKWGSKAVWSVQRARVTRRMETRQFPFLCCSFASTHMLDVFSFVFAAVGVQILDSLVPLHAQAARIQIMLPLDGIEHPNYSVVMWITDVPLIFGLQGACSPKS